PDHLGVQRQEALAQQHEQSDPEGKCVLPAPNSAISKLALRGGVPSRWGSGDACLLRLLNSVKGGRDQPGPGLAPTRVPESLVAGSADVPNQPDQPQQADDVIADVDLPPEEALVGRRLIVVVVVVPALAKGDQGDEPVVAAVVAGIVTPPA